MTVFVMLYQGSRRIAVENATSACFYLVTGKNTRYYYSKKPIFY